MEKNETSTRAGSYHMPQRRRAQSPESRQRQKAAITAIPPGSSLVVGAKTVAGIGIGLLAVVAGSVALGIAAETVLIPSLLLKLAGGIAGGGVGMARGLNDVRKES